MKKCMEFRVEGRRPIRTWLESVEADMAELEIDKEDVHDRKKWRRNGMKRKSNTIGKRTILLLVYSPTKYCAHLHRTLSALKRYFPASLIAPLPNS